MHHVDNSFQLADFMHDKVIGTLWEGLALPVPPICPRVRFDGARLDPKYESTATWSGPFRRDVPDESLNPAGDVCRAVPDDDGPLLYSTSAAPKGSEATCAGPSASIGAVLGATEKKETSLPHHIFYDAITSRTTRWLLRLDTVNAGYDDWMIWCIPYVIAQLQACSWVEERRGGRSLEEMASDICYSRWVQSADGRRNVVQYFDWLK
eukprot:3448213-Pyramimonas_sp.AAC.1